MWRHRVFYVLSLLALGLMLTLSQMYSWQWPLSMQTHTQLHPQTLHVLRKIEQPVNITIFMADLPMQRAHTERLLQRYRAQQPLLQWSFVNPMQSPWLMRQHKIQKIPTFIIEYQGRQQRIEKLDESQLSNALARLLMHDAGWVVNIQGHGEMPLLNGGMDSLAHFGNLLKQQGYKLIDLDLSTTGQVPRNTQMLILAAPKAPLSAQEVQTILNFLKQGGRLLWLADGVFPPALAQALGIRRLPGTIVDAAAADFGLEQPTIAIARPISPPHALTQNLDMPVFLPEAHALSPVSDHTPQAIPLLQTGPRSWNETGSLKGVIRPDSDAQEYLGPLQVAYSIRVPPTGEAIVIGDSDFLTPSAIGQGANQAFGQALVHWLGGNQTLVDIPPRQIPDQIIHYDAAHNALMAFVFIFGLPLSFTMLGAWIAWRRRRRI